MSALGEAALGLARHGLHVLPCKPLGKIPLTAWKTSATTDEAQIRAWWTQWPEANPAIACGPSGLVVADDDQAGEFERLCADHNQPVPDTFKVATAKGTHHWFRQPTGQRTGCRVKVGGRLLDVRGDGGYVMAPGAIHETGVVYTGSGAVPDLATLPELPSWLVDVFAGRSESLPAPSLAALLGAPASEGGRNDWLTKVAGHLARQHRKDRNAYAVAVRRAGARTTPPMDDAEVERTTLSIWEREQAKPATPATPADGETTAAPAERKSAATMLVELAMESYRFGVAEDGEVFAIKPGSHVVRNLTGDKTSLRAELSVGFFRRYGKTAAQQALADAQGVIEGAAQEREPEQVNLRVAETDDAIWIDQGDVGEHVVRITDGGWEVRADCPVLFSRTALTGALPAPTPGVPLDRLWGHLNVSEPDRPLVLAWLVQALLQPGLPHPVLTLFGEQGTAKSTLSRRLVSLIDPSPVPLRKPPKDGEAWISAAQGSYVVGLDNLSSIPDWFSDSLCRAATGDGDVRRMLYKDKRVAVFTFRRAVLLNGIDVGALRGDLASRAVVVNLERLGSTKTEREVAAAWETDYPGLVGAILTLAAQVREALPGVTVARPPRMADYGQVLAAVDQVLGASGSDQYAELEQTMAEDSIAANPFLAALVERGQSVSGDAKQILATVERLAPASEHRRPQGWPANPRYVTTLLARSAPALRKAGWQVEKVEDRHRKVVVWHLTAPGEERADELF